MGKTFRRYSRSALNVPARTACSRLRLVEAMTRTSTRTVLLLPTGSNSCSCRTRSSFTCASSGISPISSSRMVPRSATSKRPTRFSTAPVNAPLHVAEQLALDEARSNRAAVDLDQRSIRASTAAVHRSCEQFLARPGLAQDEHRGVGRSHAFDIPQGADKRRAVPDDLAEIVLGLNLFLQVQVLRLQPIAQTVQLFVREAVVQRDCHGAGDLVEQAAPQILVGPGRAAMKNSAPRQRSPGG